MSLIRRSYLVLLFLCLIGLVFYLGFLYGVREFNNTTDPEIEVVNPNSFFTNSLTNLEEREIYGAAIRDGELAIRSYGKLYYQVNENNQTEIEIRLEGVPLTLTQPSNKGSIDIPSELSVEYAIRTIDEIEKIDTYQYRNVSTFTEVPAILKFSELNNENSGRSAEFSFTLNRPIISQEGEGDIERIVLRSTNPEIKNIFI
jgi:hypothetical protein